MPARAEVARAGVCLPALTIDLVCILAFAALGRRNHASELSALGILQTAWPFLAGALAGWLLVRGWRHPLQVLPTGVTVWLSAVVIGMLLRAATSQGTATGFVMVATLVVGLLLLGWRAVAGALRR